MTKNKTMDKQMIDTGRRINAGILYRNVRIENLDKENRTFPLSFSSEEPVERFFGMEILDHSKDSVGMEWLASGRAPLLLNHDPEKQIGVIEQAHVGSDRKGHAVIRFGKDELAEQIFQDVLDGIRGNVSVGYRYRTGGVVLEAEGSEQPDVFRITSWEPLEVSIVSIPADQTVGIGRSSGDGGKIETFIVKSNQKENIMAKEKTDETREGFNPSHTPTVDVEKLRRETQKAETERVSQLITLGEKHNMRDAAMEFIKESKPVDAFRQHVLDNLGAKPAISTTTENPVIGMSEKEARDFSFMKAIRAAASGNWKGAELEREASEAVAKRLKREPASFFVPLDVTTAKRDLSKAIPSAGGYLVGTEHMAGSFIELLRNKMLVRALGARVMTGLEGDVAIPKQSGGATVAWVTEGNSPPTSQQAFEQVALTPKSVAAFTDLTRKLVLQSSPDVETLVRDDLAKVIALELDRVAINGSGAGPEPEGIMNTTGIGSVTISGSADWDNIVDLESDVATSNADVGSLAYLMNAAQRGVLKKTEKATGTAQFIWENGTEPGIGSVNGYRAGASNQMPNDKILFGNWNDLIIGEWGVLDVLVDPYTLGTSGGIRIRVLQDVDTAVRHPESFSLAST